jgi:hypothetical protein
MPEPELDLDSLMYVWKAHVSSTDQFILGMAEAIVNGCDCGETRDACLLMRLHGITAAHAREVKLALDFTTQLCLKAAAER